MWPLLKVSVKDNYKWGRALTMTAQRLSRVLGLDLVGQDHTGRVLKIFFDPHGGPFWRLGADLNGEEGCGLLRQSSSIHGSEAATKRILKANLRGNNEPSESMVED